MPGNSFNPATDIGDQSGRVFFITGGTAGLGKQTILNLINHNPGHIYFTGRNRDASHELIEQSKASAPNVPVTFIHCDQMSLKSVQGAAQDFLASSSRLDVLICNAGIMAKPPALTDDGYEQQFGVNHLAHALFVKLLLPILQKTVSTTHDARIIFLTSLGFKMAPAGGIAFQDLRTVQDYGTGSTWARYGQSKLANVIYPAELARRYPEITSLSIHPGTIATDLIGSLGWFNKLFVYMANLGKVQGLEVGSYQACWASTAAKRSITNGGFYEPVGKPGEGSKESERMELWESLWEWTEKELSGYN